MLCATFALVLGFKLQQIDRYGSDLPFWDQWDAEGDRLLVPYLEGRLGLEALFEPHNEHRIFFTRALALGLFVLNEGRWDARIELIANGLLHTLVAVLMAAFALRLLPRLPALGMVATIALLTGHSLAWENTLSGFQSVFYFVLLFSLGHLAATWLAAKGSVAWWLAPLAGLAAVLSIASGFISAAANLIVAALVGTIRRRWERKDWFVVAANAGLCIVGWQLKVDVAEHAGLRAQSLWAALEAFLHQLSWPIKHPWAAVIGIVPPLLLLARVWRQGSRAPAEVFLLSVCTWSGAQLAGIAVARGAIGYGFAPRYADVSALALICNLTALVYLVHQQAATSGARRYGKWGAIAFAALALGAFLAESGSVKRSVLAELPGLNEARERTVRDYLRTRDPSFFAKTPWSELPYPSAPHLAAWLDSPGIRRILPTSVHPPVTIESAAAATQGFLTAWLGKYAEATPMQLYSWTSPGEAGAGGRFLSEPFQVTHSRTALFIRGQGDSLRELGLRDSAGRIHRPLGGIPPLQDRWRRVNFALPAGLYQLEVERSGPGPVTFTQPFTDTRLSQWGRKLPRLASPYLVGLGIVLLLGALAVLPPAPTDLSSG